MNYGCDRQRPNHGDDALRHCGNKQAERGEPGDVPAQCAGVLRRSFLAVSIVSFRANRRLRNLNAT
jgi:hypothetical protein